MNALTDKDFEQAMYVLEQTLYRKLNYGVYRFRDIDYILGEVHRLWDAQHTDAGREAVFAKIRDPEAFIKYWKNVEESKRASRRRTKLVKENNMKKQYTKKQITEAIAYWEKQLRAGNYKKINESEEGMARLKLQKMKRELEASKGKTPSDKAFVYGLMQQMEPKENEDGDIEVYVEEGGPWHSGKSRVKRVNKSWTVDMYRNFELPNNESRWNCGDLMYIAPDATFLDIVRLEGACHSWSTDEQNGFYEKEAQKWTPEEQEAVVDVLRGKTVSGKTLQAVLNWRKKLGYKMNDLKRKEQDAHSKEVFRIGQDREGPFEFTEYTADKDIIGWVCRLYGCKDGSDLYNTLVSDETETWDGNQTAVDDFDQFRASYQDMISEEQFLDQLVEEINEKYCDSGVVQGSELRKTVDAAVEEILDDAFRNFDYSDCQTYRGRGDVYY